MYVFSTLAVLIWLGVGFSLGWYYTFTYYGRSGWPVPLPETCGALVVYYFSVLNVDTAIQATHWLMTFPVAALLWITALRLTARRLGAAEAPFARASLLLALAALPLVLPGPYMAYLAGQTDAGFDWARMVAVALRRGHVTPWGWLTPLYFGLGLASLALHLCAYRRLFAVSARKAWIHFPLSGILFIVAACFVGGAAGLPLRALLE
jgi:hypothetical protein